MAILKCKMCGGDIELSADKTFGTCDSCGSTMTFPRIDDDQKAAMFNRGNHFRRSGEFDKALTVYERILEEDESDAEAHWCAALCRFGIEYVEDPATLEYIPTCHRASFDSFLEDVDYKAAQEHSEGVTRRQYQKDAAKIAEVQKGILATSQNEEPFDVFICYKESENDGTRTRDSLLAQDIYYQLSEKGWRVFFSRITLEDKAGTEYEPYIFAALNSAKVMVVVTTSAEHVNAVWVKNEWSRYLALMRKDRKKLLLPCYRDMDPYDLPEALSVLQSYDMSKIGFIQDLIRGINKVLEAETPKETVRETVVVNQTAAVAGNTAPLLKRAYMFLEDGDWERADEFCEQVLNQDPENAEAYLGKLMAELKLRREADFENLTESFDKNPNYEKAVRFGDEALREKLRAWNEKAPKEGTYQSAVNMLKNASNEGTFMAAAQIFAKVPGYKDTDTLREKALVKAEECRKASIYREADNKYREANRRASDQERLAALVKEDEDAITKLYTAARLLYLQAPGWLDADQKAEECEEAIVDYRTKKDAAEKEAARKAEEERAYAKKRKKKTRLIVAIVTTSVVTCIAFVVLLIKVIIPTSKYNAAVDLYNEGKYEEAILAFQNLNGYKDSQNKIKECDNAIKEPQYNKAVQLMNEGQYSDAIKIFSELVGYKDCYRQIENCETAIKENKYTAAIELYEKGDYSHAEDAFIELKDYKDSSEKARNCRIKLQFGSLIGVSVGSIIKLGTYEQDNNTANGKESIEWLVLKKEENKYLAVSKYVLDCLPFDDSNGTNSLSSSALWQYSTLRRWLINDFFNNAFNNDDKVLLNSSTDRVTLLSLAEVEELFNSDNERKCKGTEYSFAKGVSRHDDNTCTWWLRTPKTDVKNYVEVVVEDGRCNIIAYIGEMFIGVRPAIWIDLGTID
ncbi:MAG: TIR domain-containing protein [Clostridia bacterium]|nr:TIR domain-containing protein [Clostridia bacterium]